MRHRMQICPNQSRNTVPGDGNEIAGACAYPMTAAIPEYRLQEMFLLLHFTAGVTKFKELVHLLYLKYVAGQN